MKADVAAGQKRIVVDLRGNGGGYITAAQVVASQFLGDGVIFYEVGADGVKQAIDAAPGGAASDPAIRVVVLIDGNSASASEIVAGALQARGRAQLIGSQSYGKGTIQAFQQLSGGTGGFRLTIARWLTPKDVWINHVGLTPDIPVTVPANSPAGADPVLDRALAGPRDPRRRLTEAGIALAAALRLRFPRAKGGDVQCLNIVAAPPRRR